MSDERSDGDEVTGSPTDVDDEAASPGGGPKRVVSEGSVDDILESLSETKGAEPDPPNRAVDGQAENEGDDRSDVGCEGPDLESEDEGLEARIESGEVTGADVRAAEAGEGREPTPAVDEIDLSLEDVEGTGPTEGNQGDDTQTDGKEGKTETADNGTEDGGLLARIRRLFSR